MFSPSMPCLFTTIGDVITSLTNMNIKLNEIWQYSGQCHLYNKKIKKMKYFNHQYVCQSYFFAYFHQLSFGGLSFPLVEIVHIQDIIFFSFGQFK